MTIHYSALDALEAIRPAADHAKNVVAGGRWVVFSNLPGIRSLSPWPDKNGNSVRGI